MRNALLRWTIRVHRSLNQCGFHKTYVGRLIVAIGRRAFFMKSEDLPSRFVTINQHEWRICIPINIFRLFVNRPYEPDVTETIKRLLPSGGTAVDVGAHIGYHTILMADVVGPTGRVVAVEPAKYNLQFLRYNVQLNHMDNITVLPYAAGSADEIHALYQGAYSFTNSLFEKNTLASSVAVADNIAVMPLDTLIEGPVDLIKLDVEGAEIDALKGMVNLLGHSPKVSLVVEWNPHAQVNAGHSGTDLLDWLQDHGFRLASIHSDGSMRDDVDELKRAYVGGAFPNRWYINLVAQR